MRGRAPFGAVLLLSIAGSAAGVGWGLPSVIGWAPDELIPAEVVAAARRHFGGGWHHAYPPFHFYLLAAVHAPVLALTGAPVADTGQELWRRQEPGGAYLALFVTGRLLSVLMAAGTLVAVHRACLLIADRAAAAFAALVLALSLPFAFYSRLANVDVPYVFWFALALLAYLRILARQDPKDYLAFAAAAVLSVCTKDQAWALYPLPAIHVLLALRRERERRGAPARLRDVLGDQRVVSSALLAAFVFLVAQNIPFNAAGFAAHLKVVTGPLNRDLQMFDRTAGGEWRMARLASSLVAFALGPPALVASGAGLARALTARPRPALLLAALLPVISYASLFLAVTLVAYDRFMLPLCVVGALFAGYAVAGGGLPAAARAALVLTVAGYGILRVSSLGLAMQKDGRYAAEDWLGANVRPGQRVAAVGPLAYLPRLQRFDWFHAAPSAAALIRLRPDFVVLNAEYAERPEDAAAREFYAALARGEGGWRRVFDYQHRAPAPLDLRWWISGREGYTNLAKVNPRVIVYESGLEGHAEAQDVHGGRGRAAVARDERHAVDVHDPREQQ
jgi:4-amino-4-deoxy-L-arabinose transferase-like glycosyltransferase